MPETTARSLRFYPLNTQGEKVIHKSFPHGGKLVITAKKTLYFFENEKETELEKEYKVVMKDLLENKKVIPVIGVGRDRLMPDERTSEDFLNEYLEDIKKYYEK